MTRAITPKAMDNGKRFKMLRTEGKEGFCKSKCRVDDEVKGYKGNSRFLVEPLEVMFRSHLDGSGFCEGEMGSRAIKGAMEELVVREVRLESSQLSIRPPILLGGKSVDKVGGTRGEGTLRKFRGDY